MTDVINAAALPLDLEALLNELQACDARAGQIVADLTEAQFHWRPGGTRWSVAECLEHLATANRVYAVPIREAIDRALDRGRGWSGGIRSSLPGRRFIASLEPPARMKSRAPAKIRPAVPGTMSDVLRGYHASHDVVRQLIADAAKVDVNRATFQNPFLPLIRVRVGTGLRIVLAHERRHLWQAEGVKADPGFPAR